MVVLTEKRTRLLELCEDKGFLLLEDGTEIYEHEQTVSQVLQEMVEHGFLKVEKAPEISYKHKIWELTEKGKTLLE